MDVLWKKNKKEEKKRKLLVTRKKMSSQKSDTTLLQLIIFYVINLPCGGLNSNLVKLQKVPVGSINKKTVEKNLSLACCLTSPRLFRNVLNWKFMVYMSSVIFKLSIMISFIWFCHSNNNYSSSNRNNRCSCMHILSGYEQDLSMSKFWVSRTNGRDQVSN